MDPLTMLLIVLFFFGIGRWIQKARRNALAEDALRELVRLKSLKETYHNGVHWTNVQACASYNECVGPAWEAARRALDQTKGAQR